MRVSALVPGALALPWLRRHAPARRFGALGRGSVVLGPCIVLNPHRVHIGADVLVHAGAFFSVLEEHAGQRFEPRVSIGDGTVVGRDLLLACAGEVSIGRGVLASDRVFIGDTNHGRARDGQALALAPMTAPRPVRIGDGAFLGVGCCVLPGVTVGPGAVVGAGAVVTRDVAPGATVVGNPARVLPR